MIWLVSIDGEPRFEVAAADKARAERVGRSLWGHAYDAFNAMAPVPALEARRPVVSVHAEPLPHRSRRLALVRQGSDFLAPNTAVQIFLADLLVGELVYDDRGVTTVSMYDGRGTTAPSLAEARRWLAFEADDPQLRPA